MIFSERYITGRGMLQRMGGHGEEAVADSLQSITPDFAHYLIEFLFGDVYTRPGLNLCNREIVTIAALTALGNATPQLKVHIAAGLNIGLTQEETTEVIIQITVYTGFLAALSGSFTTKAVFATR